MCVRNTDTGVDWTRINSLSVTRHAGDIAEPTVCCCHFSYVLFEYHPLYVYILIIKCSITQTNLLANPVTATEVKGLIVNVPIPKILLPDLLFLVVHGVYG